MSEPNVVVFDLDGTLVEGDSFGLFCVQLAARAPVRIGLLLLFVPLFVAAALPQGRRKRVLSLGLWLLSWGMTLADYQKQVQAFVERRFDRGTRHIITEAVLRLRAHAATASTLVVVTGCEERLARQIANEALGLAPDALVVGSKIERKWGGFVAQFHCLGRAKLGALERSHILPPYDLVYTDSALDLPLLLASRAGVLVRPSRRNRAKIEARLPQIEILDQRTVS